MKAFAILSLIILSSYVTANQEQYENYCQKKYFLNLLDIGGKLGLSVLSGNDDDYRKYYYGLNLFTSRIVYDCNHSYGGSITLTEAYNCIVVIESLIRLAGKYTYDEFNHIPSNMRKYPEFANVLEKLRHSCSPIFETNSRNFLLEKQARVHSMLRTDSDPDYDICLNDVAPVMKSSGEIKKLVQEAVETSDFTKVDTAFAQAIDIIQRFQGDCSQSDFLRKNEQLLKCYITATIAEFYYKGARDLISVNDIATLKSNASSIISKSDEVIDICYGLFKKD
jgi:hypothetical protein